MAMYPQMAKLYHHIYSCEIYHTVIVIIIGLFAVDAIMQLLEIQKNVVIFIRIMSL